MSFIVRVIIGNTIVILLGMTAMTTLNTKNELWIAILIGLAMLAATAAVIGTIGSRTFKPLAGLVAALEKAAAGDLSVRVAITGNGELSRLAIAFNSMMTDMNKAMRQFFSVADLVRDSVDMVRATTDAMAQAAEDVALQAGTIATASEEMSATSGDIARNCLYAAESAQKATDQTHSGAQLVAEQRPLDGQYRPAGRTNPPKPSKDWGSAPTRSAPSSTPFRTSPTRPTCWR